MSKEFGRPFKPGEGGRPKGCRNKIGQKFLEDLAAEWEASGPGCLKIMAKEDPSGLVKVMAALLPKEFEITQTKLMQLPDEELDELRDELRRQIDQRRKLLGGAGRGEGSAFH
jgi:hypothetical protein